MRLHHGARQLAKLDKKTVQRGRLAQFHLQPLALAGQEMGERRERDQQCKGNEQVIQGRS